MPERLYISTLASFIEELIAVKRLCGYAYVAEAYTLERLDKFCLSIAYEETTVTQKLTAAWAEALPEEGQASKQSRMSALRQLSLHMRSRGIESFVPRGHVSRDAPIAYIPTKAEIGALFSMIDSYNTVRWQYMAWGYRVAYRLMYCCGLRISECSGLAASDVDANEGTLFIRHSKGAKDRLVYMADDMTAMVAHHMDRLRQELGFSPEWLFPGRIPTNPILKNTFDRKFSEFWSKVSDAPKHVKHPTPHSLRHAFVVNRMNEWMAEGVSLDQMMPYLAAYLGHSGGNETFYYYHQVKESFTLVRKKDKISSRVIPEVIRYEN
ncbi:MAG: tyrosine-type recombinase/integrase [Raoultibacter sp.]